MTKLVGENIELQLEDFEALRGVSEASIAALAKVTQWVRENSSDIIGMVVPTALTEAQFATLKGYSLVDGFGDPLPEAEKKWVMIKGQWILGSDYHTLTGNGALPDMVTNEAHIAQALNDGALLSYEVAQFPEHTHAYNVPGVSASGSGPATDGFEFRDSITYQDADYAGTTSPVGVAGKNNPNRIKLNYFLKINN